MNYKVVEELYKAEYSCWSNMKQRCKNPKSPEYKNYGARGIKVCDRWEIFDNFLEDMGKRPGSEYSLERINGGKNYEPSNCKWATLKEQNNNTRRNVKLTHGGKTQTLTAWSEELGLPFYTLRQRYRYGWSDERILTQPYQERRKVKGVYYLNKQWGKKWQAKAVIDGKFTGIGVYATEEEAIEALEQYYKDNPS
jgi:hypothetical protein